jgi:nucleotide-binding universal stress UspA family protein
VKRVLCAVDLSDLSVELLECAAAIGQSYGGYLTILHVVPTFDAVERHPGEWFNPVTVACSMHRDDVIEHMRQTATAAGIPDDRVRYEAESGEPGMTIVPRALALRADTIVLGTRARRGLERLLGSVPDSILRHAPCDLRSGRSLGRAGRTRRFHSLGRLSNRSCAAAPCPVLTIRSAHELLSYGEHP